MTDTVVTVEDEQPVGAVEPQVDILVDRQDAPVVIDTAVTQVVTQEAQTSIVVPRPEIHIVAVGQAGPPGGGSSDHGALTGLADDDHTQYHNDARGDLRYDAIGAAAAAVSAHEAAGDPHPGYLTPAEGNAAYDAIGAAAAVQSNLNTHKTSADHDGRYYTETEIDALIDQAVKVASSPTFAGLTATGDLQVDGNTTLGDASGDSLTINAGAWTYGANWTATRAAGTVAAGAVEGLKTVVTFTGDSGGTSAVRGHILESTSEGANAVGTNRALQVVARHSGGGTLTTLNGLLYNVNITSGAGNVTAAQACIGSLSVSSGSVVTTADMFTANVPTITSGSVTTLSGFRVLNIGDANVGTANGLNIADITGSTTINGIRSNISAGTGKKNLNITGTADNSLAGPLYLAQDNKTQQTASAIYAGTGAPNNANGNDGDFYFRGDGTVAGNNVMYHKEAGAWVAFTTT